MIHVFFTVISVAVLAIAVVSRGGVSQINSHEQVLSEVIEATPVASDIPSPSPTPISTPLTTFVPTTTPIATSTPTLMPTAAPSNSENSQWVYPGSTTIRMLPTVLMQTSENPTVVTDWYKNRIKSLGMNTTSFIVTATNDKVHNKLVAGSQNLKVDVLITRENASAPVNIEVTITNN